MVRDPLTYLLLEPVRRFEQQWLSDLELHRARFARNRNGFGGGVPAIALFGGLRCAIDPYCAVPAVFLHDAVDDDVVAASAVCRCWCCFWLPGTPVAGAAAG